MDIGETEIEDCSSCGCSMDVSVLAPFTNVECPECGEHNRVKCQLGNYELKRRQGVGGMSLVFGAKDKTLGREVAIKILNEAYSMDEKRIEQFEQEAQITAAISHPHVVRVYTVGQAYGRFYIAMEMVAGDSLEKRMSKRGALEEGDIVTLAVQVTEGLQAAHKAGLIHRDIKPGNILFDTNDSAKIVDFGLALVTQGGVAKAEEIWATPYYVPPEALDGLDEDFRSDIYALGASLYHAISGKAPFDQETKSTSELRAIKLSLPSLKKAAPWVSDEVCGVIDRAMAFDPDDRFQGYEEMLLALKHVYSTGGGDAGNGGVSSQRARRRAGAGGFPVGIVAGAVGLLVVCGVVISKFVGGEDDPVVSPPAVSGVGGGGSGVSDAKQQLIAAEVLASRNLMQRRNYRAASRRLLNLASDVEVPSETAYWAGLQSAIVSMLDGRPGDGRRALRAVMNRQEKEGGTMSATDVKLSKAVEMLSRFRPVRSSDLSGVEGDLDFMILFAAALKNWEQGAWGESEVLLRRFSESEVRGSSEEVIFYRGLVGDYLHDMNLLKPYGERFVPKSVAEGEARRAEVDGVAKRLKTRGRAMFNTASMREQLSLQIRAMESKMARGEVKEPVKEVSMFDEFKSAVKKRVKGVDYAGAAALLKDFEPSNGDEVVWRNQMLYLTESAAGFLSAIHVDLEGKSGSFSIRTRDQKVTYGRVEGASEEGLRVLDGGGQILLRWKDIDPDSMLELHKKVVKAETSEFQRDLRLEQAICYAWLMGLRDKAGTAAAKLGVDNEIFAERWKVIVRVLD